MSKTLVIVESPAKAKTIGKFLGRNYTVKASVGHVRDLPKSQLGVDVDNDFAVKYITIRGKGAVLKELRSAAKKADRVLLASDPDREGEAISWHLMQALNMDLDSKCRVEFNEITKATIKEAIKHPRSIDNHKVDAQQARRVLDRLVGYKLSPLLWRKVKKGLSAGRVQSVTLRIISDREEERNSFEPEEYWSLVAALNTANEKILEAKLAKKLDQKIKISNSSEMDQVLEAVRDKSFTVTKVHKRQQRRNPALPFITSSLQQEAYRKINFTAKKTMRIAQQLYEGVEMGKETVGLITYMRTDSTRISETAQQEARDFVLHKYGQKYLPATGKQKKNQNKAQDAHEAIRPTSIMREPLKIKGFLSRDQYRLYKLIWERFLASQMAPANLELTTVSIKAGDYEFAASGSIVVFKGFMEIYVEGQDEEEQMEGPLTEVKVGENLKLKELIPKQHFTQPPPRYTEATLVKTLEERGIGRPSTYAPTIETLLSRGYIVREERRFYPTELGTVVIELLREYFADILNIEFTAQLENKLDEINEGDVEWKKVIKEFYAGFKVDLEHAEKEIGQIEVQEEVSDEVCDKCGRNYVVKFGRYGKFLACPGFPECRSTKPFLEKIGVACPVCSKGEVVIRRSKKGRMFFGCSDYPDCDFISWNKPTGEQCPQCSAYLMEKRTRKETKVICSNKECGFSRVAEEKLSG